MIRMPIAFIESVHGTILIKLDLGQSIEWSLEEGISSYRYGCGVISRIALDSHGMKDGFSTWCMP